MEGSKPLKNLTHEKFCQEFIVAKNATQAYLKVFSTNKERSARSSATKLLTKNSVSERIAYLKSNLAKKLDIDNEWVIKQLAAIASANIKDVVSWNEHSTSLKPSDAIDDDTALAINEVSITYSEGNDSQMIVNQKVKMSDKVRALGEIGKILNYKNKNAEKSEELNAIEQLIKGINSANKLKKKK